MRFLATILFLLVLIIIIGLFWPRPKVRMMPWQRALAAIVLALIGGAVADWIVEGDKREEKRLKTAAVVKQPDVRVAKSTEEQTKLSNEYARRREHGSAFEECQELAWPRVQDYERYGAQPTPRWPPTPAVVGKLRAPGALGRSPENILTPAETAEYREWSERMAQEGQRVNKALADWVIRTTEARKAEADYPERLTTYAQCMGARGFPAVVVEGSREHQILTSHRN